MMDSTCYSIFMVVLISSLSYCYGFGIFGFDIHHRYSDEVQGVLTVEKLPLPVRGTVKYYRNLARRDWVIKGRGLADRVRDDNQMLTFADGNETLRISTLGYLHYANISLGTPSKWFLVALDTGSDLLWVPCDCKSCVTALRSRSGNKLVFNIYSPNTSSTSKTVPCDSRLCNTGCSAASDRCQYEVNYLSNNTSSLGVLVEDVLHLITEGNRPATTAANVTFGCGQIQTGSFLTGAAPNGLFGLGMDRSSVPSILSSAGVSANSFSMCFGSDGTGRISFGDQGTPDQEETPFNVKRFNPTYNISVTKVSVESNQSNVEFSAIVDSGTSFTYLSDLAYSRICETFDSQAQGKRRPFDKNLPFEYCYDISPGQSSTLIPNVTLTMKGGSQFPLYDPIIFVSEDGESTYCLAVVKSPNLNIIGQNFLTGYRLVFNREKMVLGWKKSNCYDIQDSSTVPGNPPKSTVFPPANALQPGTFNPEATTKSGRGSHFSGARRPSAKSSCFYTISYTLMLLILSLLTVLGI